jgi:hypothetical protein
MDRRSIPRWERVEAANQEQESGGLPALSHVQV